MTATIQGTLSPADEAGQIDVAPDAATWTVTATRTSGEPAVTTAVDLNSRTYVDRFGILHVQKSNIKAGDVIAVEATSTYINPSGATTEYTATTNVTVA